MEPKLYTIADRKFYQAELVFGQEVCLRDQVFRGVAITTLSNEKLMDMLQRDAMTFLAIILIEEGKTQAEKVTAGLAATMEFKDWLTAHVRPREVMEYVHDFFDQNQPTNLWLLADPKTLSPSETETGSPNASSSVAMAI